MEILARPIENVLITAIQLENEFQFESIAS